MSSRDKDTKLLQDMLKVFYKKGSSAAPLPARGELVVTGEMERELGADAPLHRRLRALRDLSEKALLIRIPEGAVKKLWTCTRDLLEDPSAESRHAVLTFLRSVADGQGDDLLIMRTIFFHYLRDTHATHAPEDTQLRFKLLYTLTNTGKNIKCFEEQIGAFLLEWLPQIHAPAQIVEFLQLIINVVKFNATYLDEEIVHGIVNHACFLCEYSAEAGVVMAALSLLEAVLSYSLLPRAALPTFVAALCRTVNLEHYCQPSWKLMRSVLGADIGHATLQELVRALRGDDAGGAGDAGLVRGAVFYISMALWGPRRVHSLQVSHLAVLPALLKALEMRQPVVTYEVALALQALVARAPHELHEPAWDVLLQLLHAVLQQDKGFDPPNELIHSCAHATLSALEALQDAGQFLGDADALLDLIDAVGHDRPEASAMRLVTARAAALSACGREGAAHALQLADKYLRRDPRLPLRLHTLNALLAYVRRDRLVFGSEVVERVGVGAVGACALDADASVRAAAARAAADLAVAAPDHATDLIDLLEKILNRPFEMYVGEVALPASADVSDCALAAAGLLQLLHLRLPAAPAHAARALLVLLDHLDQHYKRPAIFHHHPDIRLQILEMVFALRANAFNCVGFCYDSSGAAVSGAAAARLRPLCSPLLLCEPLCTRQQPPAPPRDLPPGACVVGAGRASRALVGALTRETEWAVLGSVLRALPALLHARALALGRRAQDLDLLASTLCSMVSDRSLNFPECVRVGGAGGGGGRLAVSEFHGAVLPALAALAPHHCCLEPHTQQRIVRCLLKYGMVLRSPQPYINALTVFTLEMRDTMVKMLPEVLLDLSKVSDTKPIASPMLEFLSTLTRLPKVFASFVEDQYMSVFAILLPYTNPSRYNHYVVSLAHHVVAAWFLKCRLSYRRNFVRFIIHGLHNYIIMPFEEQLQSNYKASAFQPPPANEDSSNRQRSSSLGSKAVSRVPMGAGAGAGRQAASGSASASAAFHVELTETCVDLLARYTSTPCSVKPQRSDLAEFLFTGGQSMTWLVGHKLITITTSGCLQNSIKQGLCDRCAVLCRQHADSVASALHDSDASTSGVQVSVSEDSAADSGQGQPAPEVRRYSKHSLQHSRSTDTSGSSLSISDALQPPASAPASRQNSSENSKASDPLADALTQFTQRFEKISKEVDTEEAGWSRVGALAATGACPCWCGRWAEVAVRAPTGDAAFVLRAQNALAHDLLQPHALSELAALLAPDPLPPSVEDEIRSRSGSASSAHAPQTTDLHKSSSDTVVASEKKPPHAASHCIVPPQPQRMSTQPINIPSSPQRQSSSSTNDDDDMLLIVPEGKSRHPVRRSNSSPEMSSSWKGSPPRAPPGPPARAPGPPARPPDPGDLILLPATAAQPNPDTASASACLHATKKAAKKSDMRVSCEAIPEEMYGSSPLAHPHLMTYNSDPGSADACPPPAAVAHNQLQKTASDSTVTSGHKPPAAPRVAPPPAPPAPTLAPPGPSPGAAEHDDLPPLSRSKRSHTISVMSPTRRHRENLPPRNSAAATGGAGAAAAGGAGGGGLTPAFVFLQLYHNMSTYPVTPPVPGETPGMLNPLSERPLRVTGVQHERTIKNLDLVPPVETYKVGVLYVGPGQQDNEVLILKNEYGSVRYAEFLSALGTLVPLDGEQNPHLFLNLEQGGKDGAYTYVWHDDIMQVLFHVATAMPSSAKDPTCNEKRKYIGNDFVSIVYNDSGADFNIHTIKGQFNFCIVVVEPCERGLNRVFIKSKEERLRSKFLAHLDVQVVSDANVALLARQLALHAALAAQISQSLKVGGAPYASNSLERLRIIKRLRRRLEAERLAAAARPAPYHPPATDLAARVQLDDFNAYT